jgi:hypothetical protein
MNDDELITAARESFTGVRSATPVERIVSRSRAVRARRRIPGVAGALALAAGTALAVTTLLPSGHPAPVGSGHPDSHSVTARLAAWTVAKQANGDIDVTIRQLRNPAGLQSTLRADGLPVNVSFSGHSVFASCQLYPTSTDVLNAVAHFPKQFSIAGGAVYLVIKPSALPTGAGLAIFVGENTVDIPGPSPSPGAGTNLGSALFRASKDGHVRMVAGVSVSPVYASQQCTGS